MTYKPKKPLSKVREHQVKPFNGYHPQRTDGFIGQGATGPSSHVFSRNESIEKDFADSLKSTGGEYRI